MEPTEFALPTSGWGAVLPVAQANAWSWHVSHMHGGNVDPAGDHVCVCVPVCVCACVVGSVPGPLQGVCATTRRAAACSSLAGEGGL